MNCCCCGRRATLYSVGDGLRPFCPDCLRDHAAFVRPHQEVSVTVRGIDLRTMAYWQARGKHQLSPARLGIRLVE